MTAGKAARFLGRMDGRSASPAPHSAISERPVRAIIAAQENIEKKGWGRSMHDITAIAAATPGATRSPNFVKHQRWYPTIYDLRRGAARRLPHFAYEYGDGGAGDDTGIKHNWAALDAVEMVPRYGVMPKLPPVNVELFGRKYAAPLGVAPMGSPIVVWPGADKLLAKAAQRARVPYTLGVAGGATIEEIAEIAPDVMWLQLYRFAKNDHAIGFDLMRRADAAGVHVLMLTLDVPVRTVRSREVKVGLGGGGVFKPDWRMVAGMAEMPRLGVAFLQNTPAALCQHPALCRPERGPQRHHQLRPQGNGRRVLLGRGQALPRPLEAPADRQGPAASGGRRDRGEARHRRHPGVQPRRPPDRGAAAADRLRAGDRQGGRQPGHRAVRFRRPQRHRRRARTGARRATRRWPARRSCGAWARSAPRGRAMSST